MATVGLHQGFFFFSCSFFFFLFSEVQNWIYNSLRDSSKREGNIFVLWALGLELCVQNQCSVLLCAGNGMAPGGGGGPHAWGGLCVLPQRAWRGDPASHPLLPPISPLPCAPSRNKECRGSLVWAAGRGLWAWKVLSGCRVNTAMWTLLFPLHSHCCRAPISQSCAVAVGAHPGSFLPSQGPCQHGTEG